MVIDALLFESLFCGIGLSAFDDLAVEFLVVDASKWAVGIVIAPVVDDSLAVGTLRGWWSVPRRSRAVRVDVWWERQFSVSSTHFREIQTLQSGYSVWAIRLNQI